MVLQNTASNTKQICWHCANIILPAFNPFHPEMLIISNFKYFDNENCVLSQVKHDSKLVVYCTKPLMNLLVNLCIVCMWVDFHCGLAHLSSSYTYGLVGRALKF